VRIALRTQQILAHESGIADVVDPLGGSYAIEALTTRVEADAQAYLDKIDRMGGMLRAIEMGFVQKEIQEAAYQVQRALEEKRQVVVGVNEFVSEAAARVPVFVVDERLGLEQCERLRAVRARRDAGRYSPRRAGGKPRYPPPAWRERRRSRRSGGRPGRGLPPPERSGRARGPTASERRRA